jgi:hypothetical protein
MPKSSGMAIFQMSLYVGSDFKAAKVVKKSEKSKEINFVEPFGVPRLHALRAFRSE